MAMTFYIKYDVFACHPELVSGSITSEDHNEIEILLLHIFIQSNGLPGQARQ